MSEEKKEEWAIRDEASEGYWKSGIGWREEGARYGTYADAASEFEAPMLKRCLTARIVPAPPREMSDAEAEAWFKTLNPTYRITYNASGNFWVQGVRGANLGSGNAEWISIGHTIYDAIRAARRKLEVGK